MFAGHRNVAGSRRDFLGSTVLALTVVLATGLLGWWASSTGLCNDELLFLRAIELGPIDGLMAEGSSHPPLFRWIVGPFLDSTAPDWLLRVPSILCVVCTIVIWKRIFEKLFDSLQISAAVLVLAACSVHWLEAGFLLLPYALLTMLGSAHALFWLRMLENQNRSNVIGFVLTGSATVWVHFYGANLLLADQFIWICLLLRNRSLLRLWFSTTASSFLIVAPVVPIAWFYVQVEKPYALVEIPDFREYLLVFSQQFFSSLTFNVPFLGSLILLWYIVALISVVRFFLAGNSGQQEESTKKIDGNTRALVLVGVFLAGLPAAQAHALFFEKAMWPRYALVASWTHWPLLFLFLQQIRIPSFKLNMVALAGLGFALFGMGFENKFRPNVAFDYSNEIKVLREQATPNDGFLVQDFDFWIGPSNGDRLWFKRYCPIDLTLFSGEPRTRFEVYRHGIEFDAVPESINRFWVYSGLFNENRLSTDVPGGWKLATVKFGDCPWFPLAMFERISDDPVHRENYQ